MSSSNLVKITYKKETDGYGVKPPVPAAVTLKTARVVSDSLSGTTLTQESDEARTDRNSNGLTPVGLEVGGGLDFTLCPDVFFDDFFEGAMLSQWVAAETVNTTAELTPDGSDDQKATLTLGAEFANLDPGVLVKLNPAGKDPVIVQIITVDTPDTVFTVATTRGEAAIVSEIMDVTLPQYVDIGTLKPSFLINKAYEDVISGGTDQRGQLYLGKMVSGFNINAPYGEKISGAFNLVGNGYEQETKAYHQVVTDAGGSVTPIGTKRKLNSSIDMPLVTSDGEATDFCVERFELSLDNGMEAQNCIGKQAPTDYTLGEAAITVNLDVYNSETAYAQFMAGKLDLTPVSFTAVAQNGAEGGYAFQAPALQLAFPDPAKEGKNQQTMLRAQGQAKVGTIGAKTTSLRIYKL